MKVTCGAALFALALAGVISIGCGSEDSNAPAPSGLPPELMARLKALSPAELPATPPDVTNRWADDPNAADLGKKFFFETRFSGALLDESNQGAIGGALGLVGETGKVACSGCHI